MAGKAGAGTSFGLKKGDHVCFYGDSITEQRYYGVDVETYVRTRFPDLRVKFVNSGVGGDSVTGGYTGGIDERLERDVFPFKPNIITIMLGMNDAGYRPFDRELFDTYTNGYEHIIRSLQQHLPGVRIVLIEPTPYDDITLPPTFPGGYNSVLQRYAAFDRQLAAEHHLMCVDFMTPMLNVLKEAQAQDPKLASDILPGRVHPSAVGELMMAQALLKAWNAPSMVTSVTIDAAQQTVAHAINTKVGDIGKAGQTISWTQQDEALPFPILGLHEDWWQFPPQDNGGWAVMKFFSAAPQPKWDQTNAAAEMIVRDSGFYDALDQEPLKVTGLPAGEYQLKINGQEVGKFSAGQLDQGINLAGYRTPMLEQSYRVLSLVWKQVQWRFFAWRGVQLKLQFDHDVAVQRVARSLVATLHKQKEQIEDQQYVADQPQPTHYELIRAEN
jgi:lysophospholipase L1-like esterase